jgi:2-polyprenyl-3-methyl-5-hydroxy-6-metoxy-1,4-benzoquinol methylase
MAMYDSYYKEENYFGKPYEELITYFFKYEPKGTVLDLGCGQGRDSIAIAKLGYKVTGIDISEVGIEQLNLKAKTLNLKLVGLVDDIYTFSKIGDYDIVLLDSMLHFYSKDKKKETEFLKSILSQMHEGSVLCNLLMQSNKNEKYLKSIIESFDSKFEVLHDDYATYPEANCKYHMYVIKKV